MDVIPKLSTIFDEPFADSSQIPTYLVSRAARQEVAVSLSGDGGDEIFGGYLRYVWIPKIWNRLKWIPNVIRRGSARVFGGIDPSQWEAFFGKIEPALPLQWRQSHIGDKMQRFLSLCGAKQIEDMYRDLNGHWRGVEGLVLGHPFSQDGKHQLSSDIRLQDPAVWMMLLDTINYLPNDILVKLDRASMAVSLEARLPMLDHHLVEFAWRLPITTKVSRGQGKWLLRKVLKRYVPEKLFERPKMGFSLPLDSWLRAPLREWAEDLLSEKRLKDEGYLDPQPICEKWAEHLSGKRNWQAELWNVLMFEAWLRTSQIRSQATCLR
jgi:asparagine synthase (glutamine-hydrolysing)